MILSVTEVLMLQRCPWRWNQMSFNREGLTNVMSRQPLDLGTLVHQSLFDWIVSPNGDPVEFFRARAATKLVEIATSYRQAIGAPISKAELLPFNETVRVGEAMIGNYQAMYKTPLSEGWSLVSAEQTCLVKIPGTQHSCDHNDQGLCRCNKCECESSGTAWPGCDDFKCECCCWHQLEGTLDGLIANERGDIWILEHKTWDRHPDIRSLYRNPQFAAYVWITQQLPGLAASGLAYNGLWSRAMVPNGKKFEDLFMRRLLILNENFVDQTWKSFRAKIREVASPSFEITKSIDWTCNSCGVYDLCEADSYGEDYELIRSTKYKKRELTPAFAR